MSQLIAENDFRTHLHPGCTDEDVEQLKDLEDISESNLLKANPDLDKTRSHVFQGAGVEAKIAYSIPAGRFQFVEISSIVDAASQEPPADQDKDPAEDLLKQAEQLSAENLSAAELIGKALGVPQEHLDATEPSPTNNAPLKF